MRAIFILSAAAVLFTAPALANECEVAQRSGQLKTYVQVAQCVNRLEAAITTARNADLAKFLAMRRLAISAEMDKGIHSQAEGYARIQAVIVDITTEIQKRDANDRARAQVQAPQQGSSNSVRFCNTLGSSTICY